MEPKKNRLNLLYIALVMLLAVAPLVCMTFARTDATTENRRLAAFPKLTSDGKPNVEFLSGLGKYFEDHFAFRNQIAAVDGKVQSLFGVSSVDTVIRGTDGWLYYTASANDFQGLSGLSARGVENAVYNILLTQRFVESRGGKFLFTVAPNKNSLYPEHMPYYYLRTGLPNNLQAAAGLIDATNMTYADLFSAFRNTEETLYLKRDSHWNNKGAALASDVMLTALGKPHGAWDPAGMRVENKEIGDLGKMVYSVLAAPEENYYDQRERGFAFTSDTEDVEAPLLTTENPAAQGSLVMFRDSFGNTLLPFFAEAFGKAVFSKATPYPVERFMDTYAPDTVILEKVERNFADFAKAPPIFTAPAAEITAAAEPAETGAEVTVGGTNYDADYLCVSGTLGDLEDASAVFALIDGTYYTAFRTTGEDGDNGFMLYLKKGMFNRTAADVTVLAETPGGLKAVCTEEYHFSEE